MRLRLGLAATLAASLPMAAQAAWWDDISYDVSGFLRPEVAIKTTSDENPFNLRGNPFNEETVDRLGFDAVGGVFVGDTVQKTVPPADNDFNLTILRSELDVDVRLTSNLRFIMEVRGIYDVDPYENFEVGGIPSTNPLGANADPVGTLQRTPNLYEYRVDSQGELQARESPMALELAGQDYMIDLPKFFLSYNRGATTVRFGNQQIAWGQSLFFRVLDVPNGLDLRRHGLLDYVPEEFSDKRVPSPALRVSHMFGGWEVDSFVQHFRPTIYPNPNTPYNAIPAQFTVHDLYGDVDKEANYGVRVRGPIGPIKLQLMAARRYGPEGTFRWTRSGVNRDLPGVPGSGFVLQDTAFEVDPTGVVSADEWFHYAGLSRLDAIDGLNASITEFQPATGTLGAAPVSNEAEARVLLDTFFQASGGLRGHIAREYHRENVFGAGISHIFSGAPGSLMDQLIANIEVQYAEDRTFTNVSLSRDYIVDDEWTASLVLEKYHKFSYTFPATYFVLQGMHKSESDIFGRHLSGMGGTRDEAAQDTRTPGSANYLALAIQQPFPNLVWRLDFAALYDIEGGLLLQPAARWKPGGPWAVDIFYNLVDGKLGDSNRNYNALSTAGYADELTTRITYQF